MQDVDKEEEKKGEEIKEEKEEKEEEDEVRNPSQLKGLWKNLRVNVNADALRVSAPVASIAP